MFMTVKQAAEKWGLSDRRVRILCAEGKIPGAFQEGRGWKIPMDAVKPADGRFKSTESLLNIIDRKKTELDACRPLTEGEVARLTEEFTVEYTYNSNAIEGNTLTLREIDMVLRGLTIDQKPLKDHMEAVGHKEAFDYVRELVQEKAPLSERIIQQIHFLVLADKKDDRGVYRRVPVRIMGAQHEPVQPYLIQPRMEQLMASYQGNTQAEQCHAYHPAAPSGHWQDLRFRLPHHSPAHENASARTDTRPAHTFGAPAPLTAPKGIPHGRNATRYDAHNRGLLRAEPSCKSCRTDV